MFNDCIKYKGNKKSIVVKEKASSYELQNLLEVSISQIKIDDCLIRGSTKRCDWLFLVEGNRAIFVELKGGDISTALEQLFSTYQYTKSKLNNFELKFRVAIGKKSPVPNNFKQKKVFRELFQISKDIKIAKSLNDSI